MFDPVQILRKITQKQSLTEQEATSFMESCMEGTISPLHAASILTALNMKGESIEEITACVRVMREKASKVKVDQEIIVDCVGTGGDGLGTFNISTASGFVVAAAGFTVAKHGNRSVTSKCGSADLIEALGVKLDLPPQKVAEVIEKVGFGFLFAPTLHSAMKNVVPIRKELGIRTIFNILGPLSNPAQANTYLIGLFRADYLDPIAQSLKNLNTRAFYLVHSEDGLDEVSLSAKTHVRRMLLDGEIHSFLFDPEDYGFKKTSLSELKGNTAKENCEIIRNIFSPSMPKTSKRDIVIINAGFAISAAKNCDLKEAFHLAEQTIESGKVLALLDKYIAASQ